MNSKWFEEETPISNGDKVRLYNILKAKFTEKEMQEISNLLDQICNDEEWEDD